MTDRPAGATAVTAARIDSLEGSPHRLHAVHQGVFLLNIPTSPTIFEPPPGAYRSTFTSSKGETGFAGISVTPKAIESLQFL